MSPPVPHHGMTAVSVGAHTLQRPGSQRQEYRRCDMRDRMSRCVKSVDGDAPVPSKAVFRRPLRYESACNSFGETVNEAARQAFVLLDDNLSAPGGGLLFRTPVDVVHCGRLEDVEGALTALSLALGRGLYAAGFLSYELGYALEPKLAPLMPVTDNRPLLWMGLFDSVERLDRAGVATFLGAHTDGGYRAGSMRPALSEAQYLQAFHRVKRYIADGDVYQVNMTFPLQFDFDGCPLALYADLRRKQRVAHGAVVHAPDFDVLSLSPELFLSVNDGIAHTRPMKGTAARGRWSGEDEDAAAWLRRDPKSRAENLMIVDLLRNDLGRVAEIGSVEVTDLYTVETYRSLHQLTSGVRARLRPEIGPSELIRSLFPCGSVTGAPKIRAMEVIRELEPVARGVYTGSIGMLGPDGAAHFNVAIRTLHLDGSGHGTMGVGSAIVQDSVGKSEYAECLLKGRFMTDTIPEFELIETIRWTPEDGYWLRARHIVRLRASAAYFGFGFVECRAKAALDARAAEFNALPQRVRLTLNEMGDIRITATPLTPASPAAVMRYAIAPERTDSTDVFLFHKTTRRRLYDTVRERLQAETGCDEALFLNERGDLTEGSFTNLFIAKDGALLTPALECGLLDGTLRRDLLEDPVQPVAEAILTLNDLEEADAVYLGNSVRGLVRAVPVPTFGRATG
jgi:para-aminobenzoate synthetase/4-amino-4-deoxychorismate lyase